MLIENPSQARAVGSVLHVSGSVRGRTCSVDTWSLTGRIIRGVGLRCPTGRWRRWIPCGRTHEPAGLVPRRCTDPAPEARPRQACFEPQRKKHRNIQSQAAERHRVEAGGVRGSTSNPDALDAVYPISDRNRHRARPWSGSSTGTQRTPPCRASPGRSRRTRRPGSRGSRSTVASTPIQMKPGGFTSRPTRSPNSGRGA